MFSSFHARVVELVDTPDLGSGAARCEGSTPSSGTIFSLSLFIFHTPLIHFLARVVNFHC